MLSIRSYFYLILSPPGKISTTALYKKMFTKCVPVLYISNDHQAIIILNNGLSRHPNFLKNPLSCQLGIYMKSCGLKQTRYLFVFFCFFFCGVGSIEFYPDLKTSSQRDYSKVVIMSPFLLYTSSKAELLCICTRNIVSW